MGLSLCVFCGSAPGHAPAYAEAAARFGAGLAAAGHRLVYGGGSIGLMGVVARAAQAGGAKVTGVIPEFLRHVEAPREVVADMRIVKTMHERKQLMFELSDVFVSLPGGIGTLDETVEILTWAQLQHHTKPVWLADVHDDWDGFDALMRSYVTRGFAKPDLLTLYRRAPSVEAVLEAVNALQRGGV